MGLAGKVKLLVLARGHRYLAQKKQSREGLNVGNLDALPLHRAVGAECDQLKPVKPNLPKGHKLTCFSSLGFYSSRIF